MYTIDLNFHWRWINEDYVTVANMSKLKVTRNRRAPVRTITYGRGVEDVVSRIGEELVFERCTSPESMPEAEVVSAFADLVARDLSVAHQICIASAGDRQFAWSEGENSMTKVGDYEIDITYLLIDTVL